MILPPGRAKLDVIPLPTGSPVLQITTGIVVVTFFAASGATMYCARGEMENRIKECQLGLVFDRTSCHLWWPNQFRLQYAALAYVLLERLRTIGLAGTALARAQVWILRCRLLKVGAVIVS